MTHYTKILQIPMPRGDELTIEVCIELLAPVEESNGFVVTIIDCNGNQYYTCGCLTGNPNWSAAHHAITDTINKIQLLLPTLDDLDAIFVEDVPLTQQKSGFQLYNSRINQPIVNVPHVLHTAQLSTWAFEHFRYHCTPPLK